MHGAARCRIEPLSRAHQQGLGETGRWSSSSAFQFPCRNRGPCLSLLGLQAVLNRWPSASRPRAAPRCGRIGPVSTGQAPRPARGLKKPCWAADLPCSPRSARTRKRPSFHRFLRSASEEGLARSRSKSRDRKKGICHDQKCRFSLKCPRPVAAPGHHTRNGAARLS